MKIVVTGAAGFLGWHTRARLHATSKDEVVPVTRDTWTRLPELMAGADGVLHIAGVNRGDKAEVERGNAQLAQDVANALPNAAAGCRVVYAGSRQVDTHGDTPYVRGKTEAAEILREAASTNQGSFCEVRLPNIFGEHARPHYNTFVATFVDTLLRGQEPSINDSAVELMHVQDAAQALIAALHGTDELLRPVGTATSVPLVWNTLQSLHELYSRGEIPKLPTKFATDLFNTYRSAVFPEKYPFSLMVNSDQRGELIETVRAHGSGGQSFVSYTKPGMTRGEHFHLSKIERFVVISGQAKISLRKVLTDRVIDFEVDGTNPAVIDMPTLWVHNITNTGEQDLITMFWADQLFNPSAPDTYWEPVRPEPKA